MHIIDDQQLTWITGGSYRFVPEWELIAIRVFAGSVFGLSSAYLAYENTASKVFAAALGATCFYLGYHYNPANGIEPNRWYEVNGQGYF